LLHNRGVGIRTREIALGAFLKWAGVAATGGDAKNLIAARQVLVNGQVETRRGRRLREGDTIAVREGPTLVVTRDADDPPPKTLASRLP
jgi:ribosome-associated protein YbcJ (S4-like RNA binding protein)